MQTAQQGPNNAAAESSALPPDPLQASVPPKHTRAWDVLLAAADLLVLLTVFWIAKDWLTSSTDTYLYLLATAITVPPLAVFFVSIAASGIRTARSLSAVLAVLLLFVACSAGDIAVPVAAVTYIALWAIGRSGKTRSLAIPAVLLFEAMEDHAFYAHHGFDWIAMHHALRMDIREGQVKEGGSTITQQLAKNLFLSSDRTLWRKIEVAVLAWQMERMLRKRRILELYLNTIDYGMGQQDIVNAAQYYFHKTPANLTLAESAILVGSVPDPMHQKLDLQ